MILEKKARVIYVLENLSVKWYSLLQAKRIFLALWRNKTGFLSKEKLFCYKIFTKT